VDDEKSNTLSFCFVLQAFTSLVLKAFVSISPVQEETRTWFSGVVVRL
jgi:hypothetical protein